jgi:hypothetical protein
MFDQYFELLHSLACYNLSNYFLKSIMKLSLQNGHVLKEFFLSCKQGRIQGRRQPAPEHPLGSLKNKDRMVKNKISFDPNILFI